MSWQDKRINAINRISKRKGWKTNDSNPYFEEYDLVLHTPAKTKKEYKKLMLPKGRQHQ
jgi:hypothetical protein